MIWKVLVNETGDVRVIEKIKVKRGIGEDAEEVLIRQFNKYKHPKAWRELLIELEMYDYAERDIKAL